MTGAVAMAFFACGDNESSTAPENEENYVTNMVTIDCPTTGPQEAHSCAEERLRIGANTLTHAWIGHSNYFACETDCEAEQGTYSVDSDGVSFCIVEVPPIDSTDLNNVHYTDPNWTKYSKAITSLCKADGFSVHSALAKDGAAESSKAKIIDEENGYEIMIPDISDYCEIDVGLVRKLVGDILYIQYDMDCKEHEAQIL